METGTGRYTYHQLGGLSAGEYLAKVYVKFTVDPDGEAPKPMTFELEVPFTIK